MPNRFLLAAVVVTVLGAAGSANAGTIFSASTLSGCTNCYGLTYTLTIGDNDDAVATTYDAILNITGILTGAPDDVTHLSAVSFKVADEVLQPLTLTAAPTAVGDWRTSENNINNSNCSGAGSGFVCSQSKNVAGLVSLTGGALNLTWKWSFSLAAGTMPELLHIGAKLNNATGNLNGQLVSQNQFNTISVPDGGKTLSLLGLALAGMGMVRRRMG